MALVLKLDKRQYKKSAVSLKREDAWALTGQVVDRIGEVDAPFSLSQVSGSITGFFPGNVVGTVSILDAGQGIVKITASPSLTGDAGVGEGQSMYLTMTIPDGLTTVETYDSPLDIEDRNFGM